MPGAVSAALSSAVVFCDEGIEELPEPFFVVFSRKMATMSSSSTKTALMSTPVSAGTLPAAESAPYSLFSRANSSRREAWLTDGTPHR